MEIGGTQEKIAFHNIHSVSMKQNYEQFSFVYVFPDVHETYRCMNLYEHTVFTLYLLDYFLFLYYSSLQYNT